MKMFTLRSHEVGGSIIFCNVRGVCTVSVADWLEDAPTNYLKREQLWGAVEYTVTSVVGNDFFKSLLDEGWYIHEKVILP